MNEGLSSSADTPIVVPEGGEIEIYLRFKTESASQVKVNVLLRYHHTLRPHPGTYKASVSVKKADSPKTIYDLLRAPSYSTFVPSICSAFFTVDGDPDLETNLNPLKVVTMNSYFEYVVSQEFKKLNFVAEHYGGSEPSVVAYHKSAPQEIYGIECSMQESYDVNKFDIDYEKYRLGIYKWKLTRLLLVPFFRDVKPEVMERMSEYRQTNIALLRFQDLRRLVEKFENGDLTEDQVHLKLKEWGEISFADDSNEDPKLRVRRRVDILYEV